MRGPEAEDLQWPDRHGGDADALVMRFSPASLAQGSMHGLWEVPEVDRSFVHQWMIFLEKGTSCAGLRRGKFGSTDTKPWCTVEDLHLNAPRTVQSAQGSATSLAGSG